jgi:uncharacterized protein YndB with AHSA1/START domain
VRAYLEQVWGDAAARFRLAARNLPDPEERMEPPDVEPLDVKPLELEFTVGCSVRHAFAVWAERTSLWWPHSHSVSAEEGLTVTFEPRAGGRIFERTPLGAEHDWGEILAWEPPGRLRYRWHLRQDRADATDVEITFTGAGDETVVRIVHDGWERLGARGPELRDRNRQGWSGLLPHYQRAVVEFGA